MNVLLYWVGNGPVSLNGLMTFISNLKCLTY